VDEYRNFIFLLLPILAASPDWEPPKHAQYNTGNISVIVHDIGNENKFTQLFNNSKDDSKDNSKNN
jgi:hypothetical protein